MDKFKASVQVEKEHYDSVLGSYVHLYNQVSDVIELVKKHKMIEPKILIIGVGDNLLKITLKNKFGFVIKTMDIDSNLKSLVQ